MHAFLCSMKHVWHNMQLVHLSRQEVGGGGVARLWAWEIKQSKAGSRIQNKRGDLEEGELSDSSGIPIVAYVLI
jgi:hypothetical protein